MSKHQGYRVESNRLPYWDYSSTALYFVTICTEDKVHTLGKIRDATFTATKAGEIADKCWYEIPKHFPYATLDKFRVMPNHIHGIIHIASTTTTADTVETRHGASSKRRENAAKNAGRAFGPLKVGSLSLVLNGYKSSVSRICHKNNIDFTWQDNFHDHIIRSEEEYHRIRWYIENNVLLWAGDSLNPERSGSIEFPAELKGK